MPEEQPPPQPESAPAPVQPVAAAPATPVPTAPAQPLPVDRPWGVIIAVVAVVVLVLGALGFGWSQGWFGNSTPTTTSSNPASHTATAPANGDQQLTTDFTAADQSLTGVTSDTASAGDSLNDKAGDLSE